MADAQHQHQEQEQEQEQEAPRFMTPFNFGLSRGTQARLDVCACVLPSLVVSVWSCLDLLVRSLITPLVPPIDPRHPQQTTAPACPSRV